MCGRKAFRDSAQGVVLVHCLRIHRQTSLGQVGEMMWGRAPDNVVTHQWKVDRNADSAVSERLTTIETPTSVRQTCIPIAITRFRAGLGRPARLQYPSTRPRRVNLLD
jgi:hypothetical protein